MFFETCLLLTYLLLVLGTYFSENALLPGLVRGEFNEDALAKNLQEELKRVMQGSPSTIPYSWIRAQFSQMHLDSYIHNYTVTYPLAASTVGLPELIIYLPDGFQ